MKTQQFNKKRMGFSLIELSIVILVIGILVLGITKGSRIINKAKLGTAKSLTSSSPVPLISDLVVWYEPTLETSFLKNEITDGATLTFWKNNSPHGSNDAIGDDGLVSANSSSGSKPKYKLSSINNLPAAEFTGGALYSSGFYFDATPFIGKSVTIFVVDKKTEAPINFNNSLSDPGCHVGNTTIDCKPLLDLAGNSFGYGYDGTNNVETIAGATSNKIDSPFVVGGTPLITTFVAGSSTNSLIYRNSTSTAGFNTGAISSDSFWGDVSNATPNTYGLIGSASLNGAAWDYSAYKGEIAEVIAYNRILTSDEIVLVQDYLSKKYNIKL